MAEIHSPFEVTMSGKQACLSPPGYWAPDQFFHFIYRQCYYTPIVSDQPRYDPLKPLYPVIDPDEQAHITANYSRYSFRLYNIKDFDDKHFSSRGLNDERDRDLPSAGLKVNLKLEGKRGGICSSYLNLYVLDLRYQGYLGV